MKKQQVEMLSQALYGLQVQMGVVIQMLQAAVAEDSGTEAPQKDQPKSRGPRFFSAGESDGEASPIDRDEIQRRIEGKSSG